MTDPNHGIQFLSSTSILQADLSNLSLISKKAAKANPKLIIHRDWTLITRSGTIGRMVYSRPDMDGLACTEDVLRVIPDPAKILPGYLYAFLSSKFGVPQVVSGTYGAIIQHIEPEHIANLPVPRLGEKIERQVHDLVQQAAEKRSNGIKCLQRARTLVDEYCGFERPTPKLNITDIPSTVFQYRVDGGHYRIESLHAERTLSRLDTRLLGESCEVTLPPISSRVRGSEEGGYPYFTGPALYSWNPDPKGYLAKRSPKVETMILHRECVLI